MTVFKITYVVDDKRLPDMLRSCSGHVYNLEVVPVPNAEVVPVVKAGPKPKLLTGPEKAQGNARTREQATGTRNFTAELGWPKGAQFRGKEVMGRCESMGLKKTSHWYVIMNELKAGRVKKVATGLYEVA
jgi:hypothetical protein